MCGNVSFKKRLIAITAGNIRNGHIYLSGHHDFFPRECYGESNREKGAGRSISLLIEGFPSAIETDIALDGKNGKPRNFFRKRSWVNRFFEKHEIQEGDVLAIEKLSKYRYRIYPFETKNVRDGGHIPEHWRPISSKKPTAIDLFAGCGRCYGLKKPVSRILSVW